MGKIDYGWPESKAYLEKVKKFAAKEGRVESAARQAEQDIEGEDAELYRLAEAVGKSRLKEEEPRVWEAALELTPAQRLRAFARAVEYLEQGSSHADAIQRAVEEIRSGKEGGTE